MPSEEVIGILYGVGSAFFYGVSTVLLKSPALTTHKVHPLVVQLVYAVFIGLATVPLVVWSKPSFTPYGLYAALLWTPSTTLAVMAMNAIVSVVQSERTERTNETEERKQGVAYAVSLWAGVTIIVSFLWGFLFFHAKLLSVGMSLLGLFVMMAALFVIALVFKKDEEEDKAVLSAFQEAAPVSTGEHGMHHEIGGKREDSHHSN